MIKMDFKDFKLGKKIYGYIACGTQIYHVNFQNEKHQQQHKFGIALKSIMLAQTQSQSLNTSYVIPWNTLNVVQYLPIQA